MRYCLPDTRTRDARNAPASIALSSESRRSHSRQYDRNETRDRPDNDECHESVYLRVLRRTRRRDALRETLRIRVNPFRVTTRPPGISYRGEPRFNPLGLGNNLFHDHLSMRTSFPIYVTAAAIIRDGCWFSLLGTIISLLCT